MQLPSPVIADPGRIVGLWEFDPNNQKIVYAALGKKEKQMAAALDTTEEFIRTHLGGARAFSLDSPKSRAPRIEALVTG